MHKAGAFPCFGAGLFGLALLLPHPATAAWPTDPLVNVPLCTITGGQYSPTIASDGAGGAIVAWYDQRSGNQDIYAQRISAAGVVQWTADGVALCTATGSQHSPILVSDGTGGAIVAWTDNRNGNYDIYAQRISAAGVPQWTTDGVALCTAAGTQNGATIASDGGAPGDTGSGAIVAWQDSRGGVLTADIYAQRISAAGAVQWADNGVALCTATNGQYTPAIVPGDSGSAIVAWRDDRSGNADIYARRISALGAVQWTANGVALCTAAYDQQLPAIAPDGAGGAIATWWDLHLGGNWDIYARRISSLGVAQWTPNGVALCSNSYEQVYPVIAPDGAGGAIVAWQDYRSASHYDIYAQRVSDAGAVQWTANGVALCTAAGSQENTVITSDGAGGAIVAWMDYRSGSNYDVYARRISDAGEAQWTADGVALSTATGNQSYPTIVSDGAAGAIVTWNDYRSGATPDIYAQRVQANGQLGGDVADVPPDVSLAFALEPVRPNPSRGGAVTVCFTLPGAAAASLELLDVAGRRIAAREVGSLGAGRHRLDLGAGQRLAPGLYLVCLRQGAITRVTRVAVLN